MHIGQLTLTPEEMAQLNDIKDKYNTAAKVLQDTVERSMLSYWNEIRDKYRLHNCPIHVSGDNVWYLADATEQEQQGWMSLFSVRK